MKMHNPFSTCLLSLLVLGLTACGPDSAESIADKPATPEVETGAAPAFILADAPRTAPGLQEVLDSNPSGDSFLVSGRVGGLVKPISEDFAGFVMADEVLEFCDEMAASGHCPTPWDACCEDPDKILAARAFVQFVDAAGNPIPVNLREEIGLEENDTVVVKGRLSPDSTPENRIIIADGLAIVE